MYKHNPFTVLLYVSMDGILSMDEDLGLCN